MSAVEISVIIVSYNSTELLAECVLRVLESTVGVQLIVSDNGSTDGSLAAIEDIALNDNRVNVIRNGINHGFAVGNNLVLPLAVGAYVLFLNPDCLVEPTTLARVKEVLESNPCAAMAGCLIKNPDGTVEAASQRLIPTPGRLLYEWLLGAPKSSFSMPPDVPEIRPVEAISGAFMLVRRDVLDQIGGFDPNYFMHWEDLDLCLRVKREGYEILFVPDVEVVHVKGQSSRRQPIRVDWYKHLGMVRFLHKFHFSRWPFPLFAIAAFPVWCRLLARIISRRR